ncbi:MAG: hypothetical protein ACE37H_06225 [Phycisphaeraceae bacterium]
MDVKRITVVLLVGLLSLVSGTGVRAQAVVGLDRGPEPPHLLHDRPTDDFRLELLGLAWEAATSYPVNPHIKNRARAEERVVLGALELDQPHLAWGYAKRVVNWRRGACYAELAHYLLEHDEPEHVEYFLRQAVLHSKDPDQGWRHARVKARVAEARVRMGDASSAEALVEEDDPSAPGRGLAVRAKGASDQDFSRLVEALDALVQTQGYDAILGAIDGYVGLYRRFYDDPQRRALVLAKTRLAWEQMPGLVRFRTLLRFADAALSHGDAEAAGRLVDEAQGVHGSYRWSVDFDLPLRAELARYRVRLGEDGAARALLDGAVALADERLGALLNYRRADALRPVAEGYAVLGDAATAHGLYARVVELGAVNPNIRPRTHDVTATCVSMAVHGVEPDAGLRDAIEQIVSGLSQP